MDLSLASCHLPSAFLIVMSPLVSKEKEKEGGQHLQRRRVMGAGEQVLPMLRPVPTSEEGDIKK